MFACQEGYILNGSATVTCQENRTWTQFPTCVEDPGNGNVVMTPVLRMSNDGKSYFNLCSFSQQHVLHQTHRPTHISYLFWEKDIHTEDTMKEPKLSSYVSLEQTILIVTGYAGLVVGAKRTHVQVM